MSALEEIVDNSQSSRSLVNRMIDVLKQVGGTYSQTRTFIVVGHSLGKIGREKMVLNNFYFVWTNRRRVDQTVWHSS